MDISLGQPTISVHLIGFYCLFFIDSHPRLVMHSYEMDYHLPADEQWFILSTSVMLT